MAGMRLLRLSFLLLLAGCTASGAADIRAPTTEAERQEFERHLVDVNRVGPRLVGPNTDFCPDRAAWCQLRVSLGPSNSDPWAGARDGKVGINYTLLRFLTSDDELALVLGHEWAHGLVHR